MLTAFINVSIFVVIETEIFAMREDMNTNTKCTTKEKKFLGKWNGWGININKRRKTWTISMFVLAMKYIFRVFFRMYSGMMDDTRMYHLIKGNKIHINLKRAEILEFFSLILCAGVCMLYCVDGWFYFKCIKVECAWKRLIALIMADINICDIFFIRCDIFVRVLIHNKCQTETQSFVNDEIRMVGDMEHVLRERTHRRKKKDGNGNSCWKLIEWEMTYYCLNGSE